MLPCITENEKQIQIPSYSKLLALVINNSILINNENKTLYT